MNRQFTIHGLTPPGEMRMSRWIRRREGLIGLAATDHVANVTLAIERGIVGGKVIRAQRPDEVDRGAY